MVRRVVLLVCPKLSRALKILRGAMKPPANEKIANRTQKPLKTGLFGHLFGIFTNEYGRKQL